MVLTAGRRPTPSVPQQPAVSRGWAILACLPLAVPAAVAALGVVSILFLLVGQFHAALVLPVGLVAAAGVLWLVTRELLPSEELRGTRWPDLAALVFVLGWTVVNARMSSQNIVVFRDPATYALTGEYLTKHPSLPIDAGGNVFGSVPGAVFQTNGFPALPQTGEVQAQGSHMLQALLAVGGWVGGDSLLLKVSVALGAVGLLAVYAFGRQLVLVGLGHSFSEPRRRAVAAWLALAAVAVLSITLPMLEFSRASYTEPLAMACTFGGFALLWEAHRTGRLALFAVAGVVVGSLAMSRIDGLFNVLAVIPYAVVVLLAARRAPDARQRLRQLVAFAVPVVALVVVGVLDLRILAPKYYRDLGDQLRLIGSAAVGLLVVAAVVVAVLSWRDRWLGWFSRQGRWAGPVAGVLLVAAMAVLASRPFWFVSRDPAPDAGYARYVTFLQNARHLPIDPTRTYSEQSVRWLSWYVGGVAVAAGVLGLGFALARTVRRLEPQLVLPLAMWLFTAGLYLNKVSITPDQVWGSRRLLPLVFPLVLLGMAVAAGVLLRRLAVGVVASLALAVVVTWSTIVSSSDLWGVRQGTPQLAEISAVCAALPSDAAVITTGSLNSDYQQTVRSYCDVPAAGAPGSSAAQLAPYAQAARASGHRAFVLAEQPGLPGTASDAKAFSTVFEPHWNATLTTRPTAKGKEKRRLYLGEVAPDGSVTLLPADGPQMTS